MEYQLRTGSFTELVSNSKTNSRQSWFTVETWFVCAIIGLSLLYLLQPDCRSAILNVYFIPITIGALLLGWLRASGLAVLGFTCVACATYVDQSGDPIVIITWGCTMATIAGVSGMLFADEQQVLLRLLSEASQKALTDPLTGLVNRRGLEIELAKRQEEHHRQHNVFTLLLIDIDHFKRINDEYGHQVGDRALIALGQVLRRESSNIDHVSRLGGEEFVVIAPHADTWNAKQLAERIRTSVETCTIDGFGTQDGMTVSIGIATLTSEMSVDQWLRAADSAMYNAKHNGRNCVSFPSRREAL